MGEGISLDVHTARAILCPVNGTVIEVIDFYGRGAALEECEGEENLILIWSPPVVVELCHHKVFNLLQDIMPTSRWMSHQLRE